MRESTHPMWHQPRIPRRGPNQQPEAHMFDNRKKRLAIAGATAATAITAAAIPISMAAAGHTNTVLEADLTGRAEVGTSNRLAGDPNGRGEAYVFGIDGDSKPPRYAR